MAIFGKSKKSKQTTSQPPDPLAYPSQTNLHAPYGNIPQQSWSDNQNNGSQVYGTPQLQASAIWLAPQNQPVHITGTQNLAPPLPERLQKSGNTMSRLNLSSMSNLLDQGVPQYVPGAKYINSGGLAGTQYLNQGAALCDLISSKFDTVITLIDGDKFNGDEREFVVQAAQQMWPQAQESDRSLMNSGKPNGMMNHSGSNSLIGANYFDKVNLYANSRLPPNLPPMKL